MKQTTNSNLFAAANQLADDLILASITDILLTLDLCLYILAWAWWVGRGSK